MQAIGAWRARPKVGVLCFQLPPSRSIGGKTHSDPFFFSGERRAELRTSRRPAGNATALAVSPRPGPCRSDAGSRRTGDDQAMERRLAHGAPIDAPLRGF